MDDRSVEGEDVESLQTEFLLLQERGEDGLHALRAQVCLPRLQGLQPGGGLGQAEDGHLGQTQTVAGDVQVAQLQVRSLGGRGQSDRPGIMVSLRQLSHTIKTQIMDPQSPTRGISGLSLCHYDRRIARKESQQYNNRFCGQSDSSCLDDVRVDLVDLGGAEPTVRQGTVDDPGDGGECLQL